MNVLSWYAVGNPLTFEELLPLEPMNLEHIYNPDILALYAAARLKGDLGACNNPSNTTTFLCQAFIENGLWNALQNDINFPTSLCYSKQDDVVGYVNFPSNNTNPYVKAYQPAFAALAPRGGHLEASILCPLDPLTALVFGSSGATSATSMAPLDSPPPQCRNATGSNETMHSPPTPSTPMAPTPTASPKTTSPAAKHEPTRSPASPSSSAAICGSNSWFAFLAFGWWAGMQLIA